MNSRKFDAQNTHIYSLDLLRGLAIILMAFGHTRHFFLSYDFMLTNLDFTTPVLFLSRWITNICPTAFIMLAGVSIFLMRRKKPLKELTFFLIKRGIWLILLEVTILTFFWHTHFDVIQLQVIWAIGTAFILMSLFIHLPLAVNLCFSFFLIIYTTAYNTVHVEEISGLNSIMNCLFLIPGYFNIGNIKIDVLYNILPWFAIMQAGYCMGLIFTLDSEKRRRYLYIMGLILLCSFIVLRIFNIFGDPEPWTIQSRGSVFTVLSFINISKYPPSLSYILLTSSFSLLLLGAWERTSENKFKNLAIIGQTAMFFYLFHIPYIRVIAKLYYVIFDKNPPFIIFLMFYVLLMLPLIYISKKYHVFKSSRKQDPGYWWLKYI